jgi:hypothetical protein
MVSRLWQEAESAFMSLARIEIEEHRPGYWVAEVEAGYPACRRERVTGGDIVEIVTRVGEAYERLAGRLMTAPISASPIGPIRTAAVPEPLPEELAAISDKTINWSARPPVVHTRPTAEQVAQARRIGIRAKGSWSMTRYLREVAKVAGVESPV